MREEYNLSDVRDDLLIEDEEGKDMNESMIIAEKEFEQFGWNKMKKIQFRLICCEVIDILPFYKEWINELKSYRSIDDFEPSALNRLLIIFKFYKRWMAQNFGDNMTPKNKVEIQMHDFIDCLECYDSLAFISDYERLIEYHIEPTDKKFQKLKKEKEWYESESEGDDDENESDDEKEDNDNDNQNVYEFFEDALGDRDVHTCPIFERHSRSRYENDFEKYDAVNYALNKKEQNDSSQKVDELRYQQRLDSICVLLFYTPARFVAIGLGNSEEHRRFVQYSAERVKIIKQMNMYK